jgi:hypothetical protein
MPREVTGFLKRSHTFKETIRKKGNQWCLLRSRRVYLNILNKGIPWRLPSSMIAGSRFPRTNISLQFESKIEKVTTVRDLCQTDVYKKSISLEWPFKCERFGDVQDKKRQPMLIIIFLFFVRIMITVQKQEQFYTEGGNNKNNNVEIRISYSYTDHCNTQREKV